jgi:hypothetical protein
VAAIAVSGEDMQVAHRFSRDGTAVRARAILAFALAGTAACGGRAYEGSDAGPTGSNTGGSAGADSPTPTSGSSGDAAGPGATACNHYFAAEYLRCGGPVLPASEASRTQTRFVQVCLNDIALPGSGMTPASVEACASALDLSPCELPAGPLVACNFEGSLPGGAACNEGFQCQGGRCEEPPLFSPGGQVSPFTCGTCAPFSAVGQACGPAGCASDAICLMTPITETVTETTYTCVATVQGDVGAECDDLSSSICKVGLYCTAQTGRCTMLADAGASCGEAAGPLGAAGGCSAPLSCVGLPGMATCSIGASGAFCLTDVDCSPGLGCVPGPCSSALASRRVGCAASGTCEPVAWAASGQACDGYRTRCVAGLCEWGTCASVVPDGQPCTVGGITGPSGPTCDTFAECFRPTGPNASMGRTGTCTLLDSTVCK